jgi:heptosyltransferase-3
LSRTDSIGDVILTLPMAGLIKKHFPKCEIIFLGRTYTHDVISLSEHVDEFVDYSELEKLSAKERVEKIRKLKADVFVHVFPVKEIADLVKKAKVGIRVGTTNRLFHWGKCNKMVKLSRKNSKLHESQLNLKLLDFLNIPTDIPLEEIKELYGFSKLPQLAPQFQHMLHPYRTNIILHPKSKGSAKEWGMDNFISLAKILPDSKYNIFIGGTAEERKLMGEEIFKNKNVTDLTGKMSLAQYIAFINECQALVAASTGPLHIAAALGKKAIGLFSSRRPTHPGRWRPVGKDAHYLVNDEACKKCAAKKDCDCITRINPEQVVNLLEA